MVMVNEKDGTLGPAVESATWTVLLACLTISSSCSDPGRTVADAGHDVAATSFSCTAEEQCAQWDTVDVREAIASSERASAGSRPEGLR